MNSVQYWRLFLNMALGLTDAAMYVIAGATVLLLRDESYSFYSSRLFFSMDVSVYLLICAALWVWSLRTVGVYHRHVMGDGYQLNMLLIKGMVVCWVIQCALNFIFGFELTLVSLTMAVVSAWLLTAVERIITRRVITGSRQKGAYAYATVLVGSPTGIGRMLHFLAQRRQLNYRPVAVCPIHVHEESGLIRPLTDAESLNELDAQVMKNWGSSLPVIDYEDHELAERFVDAGAQTVMVCDVITRYSENYNTFSVRMESLGLEVAMLASAADTGNHELQVRSIQGTTIITQRLSQYTPFNAFFKRVFDIVISSLAIILSAWITIPVAIAIKATDGGPVFYTQTRIGLRGKPFRMFKFRSMVVNADELKKKLAAETGQSDRFIFKMKNDPRITPVGHFIRRFSIDELPQFLNVFRGDMSAVGPRPPLPEEYARYNQVYATRMLVKPGITGPWQVSGRSDLSAEESEALDVAYVQNWSVLGDIVFLFRTVGAVLSHKGAY
ncbi:sugar transferase [Bifidobacterium avesanii]|nr:sugar transferase [Bifidobacterium avesanii]